MAAKAALFARRYRAALLDYLLGSRERGLARAYDLGRSAMNDGLGPLEILRAHQKAIDTVNASCHEEDRARRLKEAESFLMETLSPFEMTYRGYIALLEGDHPQPRMAERRRRRHG